MTGKELISLLKKENLLLPVRLFAHDQNRMKDHGDDISWVEELTNEAGETFIAIVP